MITLKQAIEILAANAVPLGSERIALEKSFERVLREDVISDIDMPPFDKAAVDGYACRKNDIGNELTVIGTIAAGSQVDLKVEIGQCVKIMTGAVMPKDADCVLMVEQVEYASEKRIRFKGSDTSVNICFKGEDVRAGDKLVAAGFRITPQAISSLALAGCVRPVVSKKPKVGIIATGNEIVEPSRTPLPSQIRNSNSYQLLAHCVRFGCGVKYYGIAKDSRKSISKVIAKAKKENDVILLTGGVSAGDLDLVPSLLEQNKFKILFHGVSIQPGRPTVFGRSDKKYVFGIPGNPVASFIVFETLIREFFSMLTGLKEHQRVVKCILARGVKRERSKRLGWRPIRMTPDGQAEPVEYHGTAHISAYAGAHGIMPIPIGVTEIPKGSIVEVRLI